MRTMAKDGGVTTSIWLDALQPSFDAVVEPQTDVCIVGAGIAGLSTALELARQGTRVMVLDDGPIGGGETGRTSAHLASAVDDDFHVLESRFGVHGAALVAESHAAAIDWIEDVVREYSIDCDFERVDAYLFASPGERDDRYLDKELAATRRAGLTVDVVRHAPLPFATGTALRFAHQAQFHPLKYLRGLADAVVALGGKIHTGVHVEAIEPSESNGQPLTVRLSDGGTVACRVAVDATNGAFTSPLKLTIRQAAYRTYISTFDLEPDVIPRALYWDTGDPYHYIRIARGDAGRDMLIVGGGDHRVGHGEPESVWAELEKWTRRWLPIAGPVVARWSGQILEPADGPAYIGKSPDLEHVYVVTGDSGNGLTHGTIAGMLLPELMRGHHPAWAKIYDPSRTHLHGLGTLVKEAASSTAPYTDWLKPGEVHSVSEIPPGGGALLRRGLHVIAAYRDDAGVVHQCSASCTHMRGVVHWNKAERTWDCPCHGSRFDAMGRVLNGPAVTNLMKIEEPRRDEPQRAPAVTRRRPTRPAGSAASPPGAKRAPRK